MTEVNVQINHRTTKLDGKLKHRKLSEGKKTRWFGQLPRSNDITVQQAQYRSMDFDLSYNRGPSYQEQAGVA